LQWSRLKDGKTLSRRLDENEANLYRQWIANRRHMEAVIAQMEAVSANLPSGELSRVEQSLASAVVIFNESYPPPLHADRVY
jgi:hypothetical protein